MSGPSHTGGTVVSLDPDPADPQRLRIMVRAPGRVRARCAGHAGRALATQLRLRVNGRWTRSVESRIRAQAEVDAARTAALGLLARARVRLAEPALTLRLAALGHPEGAIASALRELRKDGWLSARIRTS